MKARSILRTSLAAIAVVAAVCPPAFSALHITLRNGAEFDCIRQEPAGNRIRLYLISTARTPASDANYIEVAAASVLRVDNIPDPPPPPTPAAPLSPQVSAPPTPLTPAQIIHLLANAGALHNIDVDLLASIVRAESNGNALAVSRAGAQGLMQLMPATASGLNVHNSFAPEENISGGTAYLDQLLTRYHDDIRLAVAAYNAGPAAVDRYRGIPPYAETRAYVARVIREFNRRKRTPGTTQTAAIHVSPAVN